MTIEENQELNKILKASDVAKTTTNNINKPGTIYYSNGYRSPETDEEASSGAYCQWTSTDNTKFFPAGRTYSELGPALWEPKYCPNRGYFFEKVECNTNGLLEFPETNSKLIVEEIKNFWGLEDKYRQNKLAYKRGLLFWGPPGSGKSSTIKLILKDVFERDGVAIKFGNPSVFIECMRIIRTIQKLTPIVFLLEDIDAIIEEWGETEVLNILDGVETTDKVVYLATTNYPEKLGERIINRPSRFDRRYKMPHPSKASRRLYLEHLLKNQAPGDVEVDLDKWVKDTVGMSVAHLKELYTAVCILGDPYKTVIDSLQSMVENRLSSDEDKNTLGFTKFEKEDK